MKQSFAARSRGILIVCLIITVNLSITQYANSSLASIDYIVDNFDRADLGSNWSADPEFQIANGELSNTSTEASWGYVAVYNAFINPTQVSYNWGTGADADGIQGGGMALMLDSASPDANGYLAWVRPSDNTINLYVIQNGEPLHQVGSAVTINGGISVPQPGSLFKVEIKTDGSGHHFRYYIEGQYAGEIVDASMEQGNAADLYVGVMLRGNLNNNIDKFSMDDSPVIDLNYISDNFNRADLGSDWNADPEFQVVDGELSNTSANASWGYVAIYNVQSNVVESSFNYGSQADASGIDKCGFALMMDSASPDANGYLAWVHPSDNTINLYVIQNGEPLHQVGSAVTINGSVSVPQAGSVFEVEMTTDGSGHHFRYYIDGQYAGEIVDASKEQGNGSNLYAGVMIMGNLNNNIDNFAIGYSEGGTTEDTTPPSAVTDLSAGSPTDASVTLTWTAVGDDGMEGRASSYDIRYSTSSIDNDTDFNQANQASGEPTPSDPGTQESFIVSGLGSNTTYYFAIKASDEASNFSSLSNIASVATSASFLEFTVDDFNRTDLGSDWNAAPEFLIESNELANSSTVSDWGFVAVFNVRQDPVEASFKWGAGVDADGIDGGGFALMMDAASPDANGYLAWIRPSNRTVNLYVITNGAPDHPVGSAVPLNAEVPTPEAGSVFKVEMSTEADGHHFNYYVNGLLAGTIIDTGKEQGNTSSKYAGVMLKGNLNNNIDDFTIGTLAEADETPPAAITDFIAGSPTLNSITLTWTAVGDDGMEGRASSYDVRYSTSSIDNDTDFNQASQASGEPTPSDPGTQESFIVEGLQSNTTYYFAIKTSDNRSNVSSLSNIPNAKTNEGVDENPPAAITDLIAGWPTSNSITLTWTAVGDDGMEGRATSYDVRYSINSINNDTDFNQANQASGEPIPSDPGTQESFVITGLQPNTVYYFAIKVSDNMSNISSLSNTVSGETSTSIVEYTIDAFNRTEIGPNWNVDPEFQIVDSELSNTTTDVGWGYMAVFNVESNPVEASFRWGRQVNAAGIEEGGFAILLDAPSPNANGYLAWIRPKQNPITINLWEIVNGAPVSPAVGSAPINAGVPTPGPGSVFKVEISTENDGHYFSFYVDNQLAGVIVDANKEQGNTSSRYAGVMLRGNLSNNIDDFTVGTLGETDETPPAAISDLATGSPTSNSIILNWTAVGDDSMDGKASSYDVRYSTSSIDNDSDFNQASQASGEPTPSDPGTQEIFVVSGLLPNTTYYFAIKTSDEASNYSPLSNIVNATTLEESVIAYITDNFDRTEIGSDWNVDPEIQIVDGELTNTTSSSDWGFIAIFNVHAEPVEASFKWGDGVDATGIEGGGFALMMDAASPNANGYLAWIRPTNNTVNLFEIINGAPSQSIGSAVSINEGVSIPVAGSIFKVQVSIEGNGHHFNYYVDGQLAGTIIDTNKKQGNSSEKYAGVMLQGNLSNNIDDFMIGYSTVVDNTPPSNVTDLSIVSTSINSATLNWTAVGDDGMDGIATSYDVRYSTSSINNESDFNQANQATSEPNPSGPGTQETFIVSGLETNTTYYFALKVVDDASNYSMTTNNPSATTKLANVLVDNFNRTNLESDWTADPDFQIINNELSNTATVEQWGYIAVFNARTNPIEVSFKWGIQATAAGIEGGGMALMLDAASPNTNGYLLWLRPSNRTINLYTIVNGNPGHEIGSAVDINSGVPTPQAGFIFKAQISTDANGHHFDCYVNEQYAGRITDVSKEQGNDNELYAGVMLSGNLSNNIDDFSIVNIGGDPAYLEYVSGDNQIGTIGQTLPGLLVVRVTDDNSIPVGNVEVQYRVVQGDATLDLLPPDNCVRIEAESGILTSTMVIASDDNASGSKFIHAPTGDPNPTGDPENGKAEYSFNLKVSGNYSIWGRVYTPSGNADTFFFVVDGSEDKQLWDLGSPYNTWRWIRFSDRGSGDFSQYLNAGEHTLTIIKRELSARLDKIIFSSDPGFVPSGLEKVESYITDEFGEAKAIVTLGTTVGPIVVKAEVSGLQGSPVTFNLAARAGDAVKMEYVSGNSQSGAGGQPLTQPFVVQLLDVGNNPVYGWQVNFQDIQGGGSPSNEQPVLTDENGKASTTWTLGTEYTNNIIHAVSNGSDELPLDGSPVEFSATATSGIADSMIDVSGDGQSGTVGSTLSMPFKVKIVDELGQPLLNHKVTFQVKAGGSTLDGDTLTNKEVFTDAEGFAQVAVTLGDTAGVQNNQVQAKAMAGGQNLKGSPFIFKASASPDVANKIVYFSGNDQTGAVNRPLGSPFVAKVTDQYGNGITAHQVTFEVKQGGGSLTPSGPWFTEANGLAQVTLTLGPQSGVTNEVWATAQYNGASLTNSPVIFQATPGTVASIEYVGGNGQTGSAGYLVADSFKVKIKDNFGNPVGGYPVSFTSLESANPGTFNGNTDYQTVVSTDNAGVARVAFYCGAIWGIPSGAKAVIQGVTGSPVNFSVNVAELAGLQYVSGNGQTAPVGSTLPLPLQAKVVDVLGKSFPSYKITFTVQQGGGSFSGNNSIDKYTDNQTHIAEANLTLGPTPGNNNNIVEATAMYKGSQLDSPITYVASSTIGDPHELVEISGNYKSGVVGNPMEQPFVVRVVDIYGNHRFGHPVKFSVITGGGTLEGGTTTITKLTGANGQAQVYLTVGLSAGINNNSVEVTSYKSDGQTALIGSPLTFYASGLSSPAANLKYISGNGQPASPVRTALTQPFRVEITDSHNNPVPDHPVKWSVLQGNGTFSNLTDSSSTTVTNSGGVAEVIYYPGPQAGVSNIVKAQSWNGPELNGSPITFSVETRAAAISTTISEVEATTPVPADGESTSTITVTLMDDYLNKIQGKFLTMLVSGYPNNITQFTSPTDINGQAVAYIASTKAEEKVVTILDISDGVTLQDTAYVKFTPLAAYRIDYISGTNQRSNYGTAVKNPIKAKVTDINGNVIEGYDVLFEAYIGGGYIYENQQVSTDSNGVASVYWVLGTSGEVNRAKAVAESLIGSPVEFIATANSGVATALNYISGKEQTGTAGKQLPEPLVVQVVDNEGDPISNYKVKFKVDFGEGNFNRKTIEDVYTDVFGYAKGYFNLGRVAGSNIASVEAQGLTGSPKRFTAIGVSGPAEKIVKYYGDNGTVQVNNGRWIKVKVTDIFDNAVVGYSVIFSVVSGDATIRSGYETGTSDADGIAGTVVDAGMTLEEIQILAVAPGLIGDGLKFKLHVVACTAVLMEIYNGNNQQGTIGKELVYPLSVIAKDDYGNPAGGQSIPITFALIGEKGILLDAQPVLTDENGIASARLQLEESTGDVYKVWAIKAGLSGSPLEFKATGVTNNFPLFDAIPDYTVKENQTITFVVKATDEDGDPITYGIRNLPQGAQFDSLGAKQFTWTLDYFKAGDYLVHFMIYDGKGGLDDESVNITVENVNRLPQIVNHEPIADKVTGHYSIGEIYRFMVQIIDADNDELSYEWYNNNVLVSTKNYYDCDVKEQSLYSHNIVVQISDGYDTIEHEWSLYVKTPVELTNFSGQIVERRGIELSWETISEQNNAGFNLFRKSESSNEYEKINELIIKPDGTKKYKYVDRKVKVGETYNYKLESVSLTGLKTQHDAITIFVTKPEEYKLSQNYPNPFNSNTNINYQLPEQSKVTITIYNILGQKVKTLVDNVKEAGYHTAIWNGLDKFENQVSSGIYYYRIVSSSFAQSKKMVFLK